MGEYKKITKDDIDFPNYCYFFIKEINDSLKENEIKDPGDEILIELSTEYYPYCYDGLELVVKTFSRKGFDIRIPTFCMEKKDDVRTYTYKWKLIKQKNIDDLPF